MRTDPELLRRARELRQSMTPAEEILWAELRNRRFTDFKFRRQHPIGCYIADFVCRDCMLIVELDGESHVGRENKDKVRQENLEACGYRVLRFWNHEVYEEKERVLEVVYAACAERFAGREPKSPHP